MRCDEDFSIEIIERPYMLMMRFPSLAGEYAVFVSPSPFGLIVEKRRNENATKLG